MSPYDFTSFITRCTMNKQNLKENRRYLKFIPSKLNNKLLEFKFVFTMFWIDSTYCL